MAKVSTNVGAYVGFLASNGKLLLRRREEVGSIIPGVSFKGNWELPGGAIEETDPPGYNLHIRTAFREAEEEVGIQITNNLPFLGPVYGAFFKGPAGYDLCVVVPFIKDTQPTKGTTCYVSPKELEDLANEFVSATEAKKQNLPEAKGLLSGYGKRMHCMALAALTYSPNLVFAQEARQMLDTIKAAHP